MAENLLIVESPHKAKLIQGYLGNDYTVVSTKGHIRDLEEKDMGIDINNGFTPRYVVSSDKKALVESLREKSDKASVVWLASDPDREGEAIAWHLSEILGLDPAKTRRVTYNEVTKQAVLDALKSPRGIDMDLVDAQQARRVLDRLVGFELSPVLWRKIRRGLSAGRVQSVTLRLVVDREREIAAFNPVPYYSVYGKFSIAGSKVSGLLDTRFPSLEEARRFINDSIGASYSVASLEKKEGVRVPAAPFTTSTMQQEASSRLHFSSTRTMRVAQSLYEHGYITYMRTDSTNLSALAINTIKQYIVDNFGPGYSKPRNYKTKTKNAQEAHEAIRPTYVNNVDIPAGSDEQKLYELIWKRTVASQMSDAKVLKTTVKIALDKRPEQYVTQSVQLLFDGFLKVYRETSDSDDEALGNNEQILPELTVGTPAGALRIEADCKFTQAPSRYSEKALLKKMEEIGIGRPSTWAPTIATLTSTRGYIVTADKEGTAAQVTDIVLEGDRVSELPKTEMIGAEKGKFVPTDMGILVTDYLLENFTDILDYDFTANVEGDLDKIAAGKKKWTGVIREFYEPFHVKVENAIADRQYKHVERVLGTDPSDGKVLTARYGQYGPYVQKGDGDDRTYASLNRGQLIETITLEEALKLFQLPRNLGQFDGTDVIVTKGKFGPYIKYGEKNVSLPRRMNPMSVTLDECVSLIGAAAEQAAGPAMIKEFKDSGISIVNGRYGPYIKHDGHNYKLPAGTVADNLDEQTCLKIISEGKPTERKRSGFRRRK